MKRFAIAVAALPLACVFGAPDAGAWSGGPGFNVTDLDAKCAVCHASVGKEQLRLEPAGLVNSMIFENRHYKNVEAGTGPYQGMAVSDREKLLADVKVVDQNASVAISVPESVRPGQEIQITATVKGGNGVVGVALMDTDLRMQGRPIQGDGWVVVGPPKVWGSDGKEQTKWVDARGAGLRKNINSAIIYDRKADLAAQQFAGGKATWTVRTPQEPGSYSVTAVMFYGTEKASQVGRVTTPTGAVLPKGGAFGASGRIMFAKPVTVTVR
ncbi:MAG: hypothetical protein HY615_07630 [Candidatus Rokubacteria bacterium]|nr:hypothetical protein [Candidatus Rokubacteria bacterium]